MKREHGHLQVEVLGPAELVACGIGIAGGQLWEARRLVEGGAPRWRDSTPEAHIVSALGWMKTVCEALA